MVVFGTRPEAIKMSPLVKELKSRKEIETIVCVTGQHKEMLDQVLDIFDIVPDYNLEIMKENQSLFDITTSILNKMKFVLETVNPDLVLVHGDTSTTFVSALACYYLQIPVGHVEAGLRTYDIYSPFPEEFNRQAVSLLAKYNFAPTEQSKQNLIDEGVKPESILVTGNTAIDALSTTIQENYNHDLIEWSKGSRLILLTAHRRENLGDPLKGIFHSIKRILDEFEDVKVIYPIHLNPLIRKSAFEVFSDHPRMKMVEPLDVIEFHNLMNMSSIIVTDSGGLQEEAPSLNKPVLVLRNTTERPEGLEAGTLKLLTTDQDLIYRGIKELLENQDLYQQMSQAINPYGDGFASKKIVDFIVSEMSK